MERRQSPRLSVELAVEQLLANEPFGRARTLDLSTDGLCVAPLDGEQLNAERFAWLQFQLPPSAQDEPPIRALAELCDRKDDALHYRIKYIYPRDRRRFEAFVRGAAGTC